MQKKSSTISLEEFKEMREKWRTQLANAEIQQINHWRKIKRLDLAYKSVDKNKYVVMTLRDKKMRYKFRTAKNIVLVGCGMYPYSLFDLHKQYPHIKSVGVEIDEKRCKIAQALITASPGKDSIKIVNCDGMDYDFTWLGIDDFVFVSVDVEKEKDI